MLILERSKGALSWKSPKGKKEKKGEKRKLKKERFQSIGPRALFP